MVLLYAYPHYARRTGLKQGSRVQESITVDGMINVRFAPGDRQAFAAKLTRRREALPIGESVIAAAALRQGVRY